MVLIATGSASAIYGDTVVATYQPAGIQTSNTANLCAGTSLCWVGMQAFDSSSVPASGVFPTLVSSGTVTGSISGTYSGTPLIYAANAYGGAGGTGYYPEIFASTNGGTGSYSLTLSVSGNIPGVNYFGLWFSALDAGNQLQFYDGSTLVYTFGPTQFMSLVGSCAGGNQYCGNPNNGVDSGEQFAFLNFFDTTGYFNEVVFTELDGYGGGFESDNHTVAYLNPPTPSGTVIGATPEPGSFALLSTGLLALMNLKRRV